MEPGKSALGGAQTNDGCWQQMVVELAAHHAAILRQLPFSGGLDFELLRGLAAEAGFTDIRRGSYARIARAQRRIAGPSDWLRTFLYDRFALSARRAPGRLGA